MLSSALRTEEHREITNPTHDCDEGPPGLEVRASYRGVLIGTRFLPEAEPKRRLRAVGVAAPGSRYTIGASATADAPASCELLGATDMALVTKWGAGFLVNVTPGMRGDVAVGGKVYRLADYLAGRGTNFTLPPDGRARIECGAMSYDLAHATAAAPLPRRWFAWRWREQRFTLGTLVGLALFMVMIFAIPPEGATAAVDFTGMTKVYVPYDLTAQVPDLPTFLTKHENKGTGEEGKPHAGKSGKMGDPKSKKPSGAYAIKGDGRDMHLGKEEEAARIRTMGFLGVLGQAAGSQFNSIFGRDTAVGDAKEDILGNLVGAEFGNGYGISGLGLTGTGYGGGGAGLGTIGIGRYNTLGGRGYGHGPGIGGLAQKPRSIGPDVIPGKVTTRGSLDKEIIRRIVRAHMNEVKFCYDQQLVRNHGLGGRVSVQFIISGTGQVITSFVQSTTMNNVQVESCVVGAVKRWSFPKPDGGGIAIVSYPFNFVSGS